MDGKQRLQSARQFMNGEIPAFGKLISEYSDEPDISTASFIWNVAALQTRKEVLAWYLDFNSCGAAHTQEELDRVRLLMQSE